MSALATPTTAHGAEVIFLNREQPRVRDNQSIRLRLTRRGRVVFGMLGALLVMAILVVVAVLGSTQAVASAEASGAEFGYVVVQPGESLWSVAAALDPGADPRDVVAEIVRLNQLGGSGVQAGQPIAVPLRYAESAGVVSASDLGLTG